MILVRRNPFEPMITMCDEMHRRFHESVGQVRGHGAAEGAGTWEPPVDVYETDDAIGFCRKVSFSRVLASVSH